MKLITLKSLVFITAIIDFDEQIKWCTVSDISTIYHSDSFICNDCHLSFCGPSCSIYILMDDVIDVWANDSLRKTCSKWCWFSQKPASFRTWFSVVSRTDDRLWTPCFNILAGKQRKNVFGINYFSKFLIILKFHFFLGFQSQRSCGLSGHWSCRKNATRRVPSARVAHQAKKFEKIENSNNRRIL